MRRFMRQAKSSSVSQLPVEETYNAYFIFTESLQHFY